MEQNLPDLCSAKRIGQHGGNSTSCLMGVRLACLLFGKSSDSKGKFEYIKLNMAIANLM